jgi:hypothetical protein
MNNDDILIGFILRKQMKEKDTWFVCVLLIRYLWQEPAAWPHFRILLFFMLSCNHLFVLYGNEMKFLLNYKETTSQQSQPLTLKSQWEIILRHEHLIDCSCFLSPEGNCDANDSKAKTAKFPINTFNLVKWHVTEWVWYGPCWIIKKTD